MAWTMMVVTGGVGTGAVNKLETYDGQEFSKL